MKPRGKSFRLRLAVSTALLAGVALAGFAAIAWWQMRNAQIDALDRQIRDQVERELLRQWPAEHWAGHEHNMNRAFGAQTLEQSLLLVQNHTSLVFRSEHWPTDLNPDALPWPRSENQPNLPELDHAAGNADGERPPEGNPGRSGKNPRPRNGPPPPFPPQPEDEPAMPPPPRRRLPVPAISFVSLDAGNRPWRFGIASTVTGEKLAMGVDLALAEAELTVLRNAFLLATPLALVFIGLGAWFLSGRALWPIRHLTDTMEGITAKGLDQRIPLGKEDQEFRQLIHVFNGMLERLERSFLQASRFSADAAHELKTPLAILQGQIEQAMAQCEAGSPVQSRLTDILDEVQRLGTISRKLLLLSLADAGRLRLNITRFDLSQALEDLAEDAHMLAPELEVDGSIAPGLMVNADAALLLQLLHNLLSNAIKYNLPKGWIRIAASRAGKRVEISFANASKGIPASDHKRIFERFYRADPSRNRQIDGVGLGLSLSREIARAHGGDLLLAHSREGEVRFVVVLAI